MLPLSRRLSLERFEDRLVPAPLTFTMDSFGNLTVTGTPDNANGGLTFTTTAPDTFTITDGVTPVLTDVVVSRSIRVITEGSDDTVTLDLSGGSFGGDFSFDGRAGSDTFNMTGANPLGGNLTLTNVNSSMPTGVTIGGNVTVNSSGENPPPIGNNFIFTGDTIGGNIYYTGGNTSDTFDVVASTVGGNTTLSVGASVGGTNIFDGSSSTFGGNVVYSGGSGDDNVILSTTVIGGSLTANMGAAITSGGTGNSLSATGTVIGRSLSYIGGTGVDVATVDGTSVVGTTAYFSMGEGANTVTWNAQIGSNFSYYGGTGVDTVTYTPAAGSARVRFTGYLGAGNDGVTFGSGAGAASNPSYAYIDFGAGTDSVSGTLNFPFTFLNLP